MVHGLIVGTVTTCSRKFSVLELHASLASQRMLSDWIQVLTGPEVQSEKRNRDEQFENIEKKHNQNDAEGFR